MDSPDQDFLKEYKPLHVPHEFEKSACTQDNVIYALAQLKEATANEVAVKLNSLDPETDPLTHQKDAEDILNYLFNKGLIKAINKNGALNYNLSKIEIPNSGKADELF
jgi:MoaA/NifB/PqqE/SkfB family radical SAM enzyme